MTWLMVIGAVLIAVPVIVVAWANLEAEVDR